MVGGLRPPPADAEAAAAADAARGVVFVLVGASLETAKVGKSYVLLNCDDHATFLRKHGRDPAALRPDIAHQALLALLDSPLAKAGKIKALYIHTSKNVLIQVHPSVRLPRTFKRFCGLFVQLLHKLTIRASNGPDKLLRVIKGPVERHLPPGAPRVALSRVAPDTVALKEFAAGLAADAMPAPPHTVFVVGAQAHGQAVAPYVDRWMSISQYPLSAACVLSRITGALEEAWGIS